MKPIPNDLNLKIVEKEYILDISGDSQTTSNTPGVLETLNPFLRDMLINSPLENTQYSQFILNTLNYNLILHFIILYLMVMLLIIFLSK